MFFIYQFALNIFDSIIIITTSLSLSFSLFLTLLTFFTHTSNLFYTDKSIFLFSITHFGKIFQHKTSLSSRDLTMSNLIIDFNESIWTSWYRLNVIFSYVISYTIYCLFWYDCLQYQFSLYDMKMWIANIINYYPKQYPTIKKTFLISDNLWVTFTIFSHTIVRLEFYARKINVNKDIVKKQLLLKLLFDKCCES